MMGRAGSPLPAERRLRNVATSANARRRAEDCPPYPVFRSIGVYRRFFWKPGGQFPS